MRLITLLLSLLCLEALAGGKGWPGVPYSRVEISLYNLEGKLFGQHSPVKDGKPDPTMIQPVELTKEQDLELQKWFMQDTRVLEGGLSSCYIPHHAIIYYDENNKPVAWMSICFMCAAIRKYYPEQTTNVSEPRYNSKTEKKALDQLEQLKKIVLNTRLPIFSSPDQYAFYAEKLKKKAVKATITNDDLLGELTLNPVSHLNLKDFVSDSSVISTKDTPKISAGGDVYYFYTSTYNNSVFEFSGIEKDVTYLDHAVVKDFDVTILNKVRIGMSLDELLNLFPVYDGPSDPTIIKITNEEKTKEIIFHFTNGNLQWYEVSL